MRDHATAAPTRVTCYKCKTSFWMRTIETLNKKASEILCKRCWR